ncbi:MAG TPA: hypothetical protein VF520_11910 [Thermoleophilaceae bacterium]
MAAEERFWTRRLRWRLIGAWRWPAFFVAVAIDGVLLHELPPVSTGMKLPVAFLLASFGNLALLAAADALARFAQSKRAERGIEDPHLEVLLDRGGVALMAVGVVGVLASGLATRPLVVSETRATEENAREVRRWVLAHGGEEYRRNLETAQTTRLDEGYFRTCVSDDRRRRYLCLFVDTNEDPAKVVRDPSTEPNPDALGR